MDRRLIAIVVSAALLAVVVVVVLVARGGDSGDSSADLTDTTTKPAIEVPSDPPPSELEIEDIVVGDGAEAARGDQLTVQYVGVNYAGGAEFGSSWEGQPLDFQLGAGDVIEGWDEGIEGMRVGGRRQLVIPPDLAYGEQAAQPGGPSGTLVFVIDLVSVN